jgi:hypothetical protein
MRNSRSPPAAAGSPVEHIPPVEQVRARIGSCSAPP